MENYSFDLYHYFEGAVEPDHPRDPKFVAVVDR